MYVCVRVSVCCPLPYHSPLTLSPPPHLLDPLQIRCTHPLLHSSLVQPVFFISLPAADVLQVLSCTGCGLELVGQNVLQMRLLSLAVLLHALPTMCPCSETSSGQVHPSVGDPVPSSFVTDNTKDDSTHEEDLA